MSHDFPFLELVTVVNSCLSLFLVMFKFSQKFEIKKLCFLRINMHMLFLKIFLFLQLEKTQNA